jgi:hypothetical protein
VADVLTQRSYLRVPDAAAAEAEAIVGPIVEGFEATVATRADAAIGADVAASLESIAADAPTVEAEPRRGQQG